LTREVFEVRALIRGLPGEVFMGAPGLFIVLKQRDTPETVPAG
jgi:hypothetical protein